MIHTNNFARTIATQPLLGLRAALYQQRDATQNALAALRSTCRSVWPVFFIILLLCGLRPGLANADSLVRIADLDDSTVATLVGGGKTVGPDVYLLSKKRADNFAVADELIRFTPGTGAIQKIPLDLTFDSNVIGLNFIRNIWAAPDRLIINAEAIVPGADTNGLWRLREGDNEARFLQPFVGDGFRRTHSIIDLIDDRLLTVYGVGTTELTRVNLRDDSDAATQYVGPSDYGTVLQNGVYTNRSGTALTWQKLKGNVYFFLPGKFFSDPITVRVTNNGLTVDYVEKAFVLGRSDGTVAGTQLIAHVGSTFAAPSQTGGLDDPQLPNAQAWRGALWFLASTPVSTTSIDVRCALMRSDGTASGTKVVTLLPKAQRCDTTLAFQDQLYLKADYFDATLGQRVTQHFTSNGTAAGTQEVSLEDLPYDPEQAFRRFSGATYFVRNQGAANVSALWRTDGSVAGTTPVDVLDEFGLRNVHNFFTHQGRLFFAATDNTGDLGLWRLQATPQSPADTTLLVPGVADTNRRGWRYGSNANKDNVSYAFVGGEDMLLSLRGFDIDFADEATVWVNNSQIGALSMTRNNRHSKPTYLVITQAMQRTGINTVEVRQSTPGYKYGVTDATLTPVQGPVVFLTTGIRDKTRYGYKYANASEHPGILRASFERSDRTLRISVRGYDIDFDDEVEVVLNGNRLGYLQKTDNNGEVTGSNVWFVSPSEQLDSNMLEFKQKQPGFKWGIRNLFVRPDA